MAMWTKRAWAALLLSAVVSLTHAQTVEYIHTDALGTPVAVTNSAGQVVERSEYEPFGRLLNRLVKDGPGYTGHISDATTGLSYMQQRYYDPGLGRFLSVDPVTASPNTGANFNRYWYANNNPYKFTDPDGRQSESVMDGRYVYSHLSPEQAAALKEQHDEIGGQVTTGMATGVSLAFAPELLVARGGVMLAGRIGSSSFSRAFGVAERLAGGLERTGGSSSQRTWQGFVSGGRDAAQRLFNSLTRGESAARGGGRLGTLRDGSAVQTSTRTLRDGTIRTDVRISREVTPTGSRIPRTENIKLRFDEKPQ